MILRHRRSPLTLPFSAAPWIACGYLLSYLVLDTALFAVVATVVLVCWALSLLSLGVPLLIGAALVVRGCAEVERHRTRLFGQRIDSSYLPSPEHGLLAMIKARWTDPAVLRDCAYLGLLYLPLALLDLAALVLWLACVAGVTLPLWFWLSAPTWYNGHLEHGVKLGYFPSGPEGRGGIGVFVGDLPTALLMAACFLLLSLLGALAVVSVARLHSHLAERLLSPYRDPLAEAKAVLAAPGPLGTLP
ncbi:sensor domain-containing protein [Kutzneria albida]|uniref:Putative sensor domain-containing protein n=1 Tax=Kutzneria albida DSM 43870 TaxID=1449976 RepID=W5WEK5_9PSEU|nr:sensor domain-containing protein [Kutzneria albida]AHH99277.1 hypothetical protein KALB_5916 [Kutzneria albida DSM 43870]